MGSGGVGSRLVPQGTLKFSITKPVRWGNQHGASIPKNSKRSGGLRSWKRCPSLSSSWVSRRKWHLQSSGGHSGCRFLSFLRFRPRSVHLEFGPSGSSSLAEKTRVGTTPSGGKLRRSRSLVSFFPRCRTDVVRPRVRWFPPRDRILWSVLDAGGRPMRR